ncbi:MAG: universal stress protein [Bacillota bacterium]
MVPQILFITDGSPSAEDAGKAAIQLALSGKAPLKAIYVLDEGWKHLLGDEWINTSSTRMNFFHWYEDGLMKYSESVLEGFRQNASDRGVDVHVEVKIGKTEKVIAESANSVETAMLVLPNPHSTAPGAAAGLRYNLHSLSKRVRCPIYVGSRL